VIFSVLRGRRPRKIGSAECGEEFSHGLLGVSYERLSYEMGFWNVEGAHAYAVIARTLTGTIKGQTVARTGTLAYTFSKHGEQCKIDPQAWGRTS
jgi:hypothetical protein